MTDNNYEELSDLLSDLDATPPEIIWSPVEGEAVAGVVTDIVEGEPPAIILRNPAGQLIRINLRAKNLLDMHEENDIQPGDLLAVKFSGTGTSPTGTKYKMYSYKLKQK